MTDQPAGRDGLAAELEALAETWRASIAMFSPVREFSREAGFYSALTTCTHQLEETLQRHRDDD